MTDLAGRTPRARVDDILHKGAARRVPHASPSRSAWSRSCVYVADPAARASPSATGARCRPSRTSSASPTRPAIRPTSSCRGLAQLVPDRLGRVPGQPPVGGAGVGRPRRHGRASSCGWASGRSSRRPRRSPWEPSPTVWAAATVAEVNPLHLLFVALLLHRALVWEERRRTRDLVIGALLLGLALGNHLLIRVRRPVRRVLRPLGRAAGDRRQAVDPAAPPSRPVSSASASTCTSRSRRRESRRCRYNHPVTLDAVLWLVGGTQFRGQFGFLSASGLSEFVGSLGALWRLLADRATPRRADRGRARPGRARPPAAGVRPDVRRDPGRSTSTSGRRTCASSTTCSCPGWSWRSASASPSRRGGAATQRRRPALDRADSTPAGSSASAPWSSPWPSPLTNWPAADRSGDRSADDVRRHGPRRRCRRTRPSCPSGMRRRRCGTPATCWVAGPTC